MTADSRKCKFRIAGGRATAIEASLKHGAPRGSILTGDVLGDMAML